jgi:two-component system phosphate regulon sensor histidine kinase PhoR
MMTTYWISFNEFMLQALQIKFFLKRLRDFFHFRRHMIFRTLLCWMIACVSLLNDEINSFDERFQIRGEQPFSSEIVAVVFRPPIRSFDSNAIENSEEEFWDKRSWKNLLQLILKQNPQSVGVLFQFPDLIKKHEEFSKDDLNVFRDPKIFWSTELNLFSRPKITDRYKDPFRNLGHIEFRKDEDGLIRRFSSHSSEFLHLAERMSGKVLNSFKTTLINFRGTFVGNYINSNELLSNPELAESLKNKYVLIGPSFSPDYKYLTPMGPSDRLSLVATVLDNFIENRWIQRAPNAIYFAGLLILAFLALFVITQYPQTISSILMLWMATLTVAVSVWIFDSYYIWLPIISPLILLFTCWIVLTSYQSNIMERKNWQLKQDQEYLKQLEQMKSNFVSLISHDLKTPIAKIQAVINRMKLHSNNAHFEKDLNSLKSYSEELHRYIESILKLLKAEAKDFKLNKTICDFNEIIEKVIEQLKPLAQEKNQKLFINLEPLFTLEIDDVLIREVVLNLIENAIKYSPPESEITVLSYEKNDKVFFQVKDQGEGIPQDEIPFVFEKFTRGKSQELISKGSGLGLYLVKYFIELHGGKVFLESKLKVGTTVTFFIPIEGLV